jgi:hypothetical protein
MFLFTHSSQGDAGFEAEFFGFTTCSSFPDCRLTEIWLTEIWPRNLTIFSYHLKIYKKIVWSMSVTSFASHKECAFLPPVPLAR